MTIRRRDFQKAAALIHEFQLKLSEEPECAELRDALNLALLHMQKYYRILRNKVQKFESDRASNGHGVLGASLRGLSPMTPFKDAPDKFQWKWVNLDTVKLSGTLPAEIHQDVGTLPKVIHAAKIGDNNRLMQLANKNADVIHELDGLGRNALMYGVHFGNLDTVQILLEHGTDINCTAHDGSTAVHVACHDGNNEALRMLIEYEAALSLQDTHGRAPIHWACTTKDKQCLKLLLENGCNVHIRDKEGMTPCMWACRMDRIEHFELLSEADPHVCDEEEEDGFERDLSGKTWMHWSVRRTEPLECLKTLLTEDSAQLQDEEGKSVIHSAAEQGSLPSVKVVLEIAGNAVIDGRDNQKRTPLVLATMGGHGEVVNYLLSQGADLSCVDINGATAWDYARGRQLHYCMLIIASYIRQRARDRGEEVDMTTLAQMTFAGVTMTGTLLNQAQQEASEEDEAEDPVDRQINGLHIDGEADGVYRANMPRPPPRHTQAPVTPRTPRAPVTPRTPRASVTPRTPRPRAVMSGAQSTPRGAATPRNPTTPRRGDAGDAPTVTRSQKRAPSGPVESSTEDEMVFEKQQGRPVPAGKRTRRNEVQQMIFGQRHESDMRVMSVMSMDDADMHNNNRGDHVGYVDFDNPERQQYEEDDRNRSDGRDEEEEEEEEEGSVSIGAMDVSEVDPDAEEENEMEAEDTSPDEQQHRAQVLERQSSHHDIPAHSHQHETWQPQHQQEQHKQSREKLTRQDTYNINQNQEQQQQARRSLPQSPPTLLKSRNQNRNAGGFHQPRPPVRYPPYPAHAVKPPSRAAPEEEFEEEDEEAPAGFDMPNEENQNDDEEEEVDPVAVQRHSQYQQNLHDPSSDRRRGSGDVHSGQTPPAYLQPLAPPSPTKKKKKKKRGGHEELPPPQAHGWGARPPAPASTHASHPAPLQGPVPQPHENRAQTQSKHQREQRTPTPRAQGKRAPLVRQNSELEERHVSISLPPASKYTLDQQLKPSPPVPRPTKLKQSAMRNKQPEPPSPHSPLVHHPPSPSSMQSSDPHPHPAHSASRGRVSNTDAGGSASMQAFAPAPQQQRAGSASQQRYTPPPLQNAPRDAPGRTAKQAAGGMFPQNAANQNQNRHPPSPRGLRRGQDDSSSGSVPPIAQTKSLLGTVPPIGQQKSTYGKLPSFGKS